MVRRPVRQPAQAQAKCISACLTAKHLSGGEGFHTNFGAILGECAQAVILAILVRAAHKSL